MSTYVIHKGVNQPLEFRGLKAQYVLYLAAGLAGLLLTFAICYLSGVPTVLCLGMTFTGGAFLFRHVSKLSRKYGQFGLLKKRAARRIPASLSSKSGKVFQI